jgi:hypothetical protein
MANEILTLQSIQQETALSLHSLTQTDAERMYSTIQEIATESPRVAWLCRLLLMYAGDMALTKAERKDIAEDLGCDETPLVMPEWFDLNKTIAEYLADEPEQINCLKKRASNEKDFELRLEAFLQVNGFFVERQVSSSGKRLDLWLPGIMMIECKAGRVTGDDVCQGLDYLASFRKNILLIGTGLSTAASRGIEAANKLSEVKLIFVTHEASFDYLKSFKS